MSFSTELGQKLTIYFSKLEAEINEKLQECHVKLLQAGVDQKETEKEAKRKEVFANLQRIFPGILTAVYSIIGGSYDFKECEEGS